MNRFYNVFISVLIILCTSCEKDSNIEASTKLLKGWKVVKEPINITWHPTSLNFINSEIGYSAGSDNCLYKTKNRGLSWEKIEYHSVTKNLGGYRIGFRSMIFLTEEVGFLSVDSIMAAECSIEILWQGCIILKTINGGKTWNRSYFEGKSFSSLYFYDENNGVANLFSNDSVLSNSNPFLVRTFDGGKTWKNVFSEAPIDFIGNNGDVYFHLYKSVGTQFYLKDMGKNLKSILLPTSASRVCHYSNESTFFVFDHRYSEYHKTQDGGLNWIKLTDLPFIDWGTTHFYDQENGFIINKYYNLFSSFEGTVFYQTFDGGKAWNQSELSMFWEADCVTFPLKGLGYGISSSYFYTLIRN